MTDYYVRESGGDFSTLASALSDAAVVAGDRIFIDGSWTVDDTAAATVQDANITIEALGASRVNPRNRASPTHYRLRHSGGSHCITVNNPGCIIDGIEIQQGTATGSSDECVRINNVLNVTVKNCCIWANQNYDYQDGVYLGTGSANASVTVENCCFFEFGRTGINAQNLAGGSRTLTLNINSCTGYRNGSVNVGNYGGSIGAQSTESNRFIAINVLNSIGVGTVEFDDFSHFVSDEAAITWNIHNCIDSDGSINTVDPSNVGCLLNRTATDSAAPGAGNWVMFNDITGLASHDLTLQNDAADNDAQEMHTNNSGAGMNIPATDLEGDIRNSPYDCGFDTVSEVPEPSGGAYVGSDEITGMYVGATTISKAYIGSTQIFPKE